MASQTFGHYEAPLIAEKEELSEIVMRDFLDNYTANVGKKFMATLYKTLISQSQIHPEKSPVFQIWLHDTEPFLYFSIHPDSATDMEQETPRFLAMAPSSAL